MSYVHRPRRNFPVPIDASWSLMFDEEFNGNAVDTTAWDILNNSSVGQDSNAVSGNNVVQNGFLRQQITNVASGGKNWSGAQIFQWTDTSHANGWIGGYFETRCKMPSGPNTLPLPSLGAIPSVWMNHLDAFPENDIVDFNGGQGEVIQATYTNPDLTGGFGFNTGYQSFDPTNFHVYGMLWTSSAVTYYIDGVQTGQFVNGGVYNINGTNFTYSVDTATPQYLIIWNMINLASAGTPNANSVFPYNFYVDYVHVYQKDGVAAGLQYPPVTPQANYGGPGDAIGSGSVPGF